MRNLKICHKNKTIVFVQTQYGWFQISFIITLYPRGPDRRAHFAEPIHYPNGLQFQKIMYLLVRTISYFIRNDIFFELKKCLCSTVCVVREVIPYTSSVANPLILCQHCSLLHITDTGDALSEQNKLALLHLYSTQYVALIIWSFSNKHISIYIETRLGFAVM